MFIESLQILFDGLCVGLASSVTVGPVAVLCIQRTISKGHLSGIMSGLGIAVADTLMAILAFTVYALIKSSIDEYNTAIQICGGIFVVIVGIFIFFKNPVPQIRKNRAGRIHLWQDFISMFGFTMANFVVVIPYILAFFTMFNIDLASTPTQSEDITNVQTIDDVNRNVDENDVEFSDICSVDAVSHEADAPTDESGAIVAALQTTELEEQIANIEAQDSNIDEATNVSNQPKGNRMLRNTLVLLGFFIGAVVWWLSLTSLINLFRRGFRPRHMLTINHVAGIIISALGIYTLISVLIS